MNLETYQKLKKQIDVLQRDSNRVEGQLDSVLDRLNKELKCNSIEEAEKLLKKVKKQEQEAEKEFNAKREEFENNWKDKLEGVQ